MIFIITPPRKYLPFLKRIRKAGINDIRVGRVDTAQFAFRLKALKGVKWFEDFNEADGVFIQQLKARNEVKIINKTLAYYNKLQ